MVSDYKGVAVVTGAAGFAGYCLTAHLLFHGYKVYAVVRPGSEHNRRLEAENIISSMSPVASIFGIEELTVKYINTSLQLIESDADDFEMLDRKIDEKCDVFFHLAWGGGRDAFGEQVVNISYTVNALEAAARMGCKRFVCTGSQAEYGIKNELIKESSLPEPINAYGASKLAALVLSKRRAEQLGIEWIWGRIFSLFGLYEPQGRMLPYLIDSLKKGIEISLSDCSQNWDYLDVRDAAEALIAISEKGHPGEIYNIANGDYKSLRLFVETMESCFAIKKGLIEFGEKADPYVSLSPDVSKLKEHTGWEPKLSFLESLELLK